MLFPRFIPSARFLALVLLLVSSSALGAGDLSGRVFDSQGAVSPQASVTLLDASGARIRSAVTDQGGLYRFRDVRPGRYLLRVELRGFQDRVEPIEISAADAVLDLRLELNVLADQVVVTATGSPQKASESPRASFVIDADELHRRRESFLGEALLSAPGVRAQRLSGPGGFTEVRMRGLRPADTGLLIDGFQIRDAGGFRGDIGGFWEDFLLAGADRIEVLAGAGSSLYGSSAGGGVVNIIPDFGAGEPSFELGFEAGSLEFFQESFRSRGSLSDEVRYSLAAVRSDLNAGVDGNDVYRNTTLSAAVQADLSSDIQLTGIVHFFDAPRLDLNSSPFPIGPADDPLGYTSGSGPVAGFVPDLDDPDNRRRSRLFSGILDFQQRINSFWSYSLYFQDTETRVDFADGPAAHPLLDDLGVFEFAFDSSLVEGTTRTFGTKHWVQAGSHHLFQFGLEHLRQLRSDRFVGAGEVAAAKNTDRQRSTAFFVQDEMAFAQRRLRLTASFRAEFFTVDNPPGVPELEGLRTPDAYTGGLAAAYLFRGTGTKLRAQAANGFRAPSLSERFAFFVSEAGPLRIGNPLLRPERLLTLDAGIEQRLADDRLLLSATYFYNRLQEIITSTALFQQANSRGGLSRGAEFFVRARLASEWDFDAAYTYTKADFIPGFDVLRADNSIADGDLSRPLLGIPGHQWHLGLNWRRGRWNANLDYSGVGKYPEVLFAPTFPFTRVLFDFDGYNRVDLALSYAIPLRDDSRLELYVRGENVLDDAYTQDGFTAPGASAWAGLRLRIR